MDTTTTSTGDYHMFRQDRKLLHAHIASILETVPEASTWALGNIERWLAHGRLHPAPLLEWRSLLQDPKNLQRAIDIFRLPDDSTHVAHLRSCSPFVGGPFAKTK